MQWSCLNIQKKQMIKLLHNKKQATLDNISEESYEKKKDDEDKLFTGKEKVLLRFLKKLKIKKKEIIIEKIRNIVK